MVRACCCVRVNRIHINTRTISIGTPNTHHPNHHYHHHPHHYRHFSFTPHTVITATASTTADATTTRDDRGFRYRIAAAPPDGSAPDRVTAVVLHTSTATTPALHRSRTVFFRRHDRHTDIIVVVQPSTRCSPHFIAGSNTASGSNIF